MRIAKFVFATALMMSCYVSASVVVHIEPGPYGGDRVITPWGDYIVVTHDDGSIWVGTEDEYDRGRVTALAAKDGMKPVEINGERVFVSAGLPTLKLGSIEATNINVAVLFGVGANDFGAHRPAKPQGDEYVSISWTQSRHSGVSVLFADTSSRKIFSAYRCGFDAPTGTGYCEFLMPQTALPHRFVTLFLLSGAKPAALPPEALTAMYYKALVDKARTGTPIDGDNLKDLHRLHELDPGVPNNPPVR
ncbi:hypothetical protein [Rhodanobacter sp. OR87]|uniref:hypothetical protein n=1 Tax=Rhodanobacter sp. OR87 TaxID=1076523 RepID=UPI0012DC0A96|nr:hypothetical protein [Rhodanobacter sp. OR87]